MPAKPSPRLLLATLSPEQDDRAALSAAKQLRSSTDQHICNNEYVSVDLTREQCVHDYNLHSELRRRRTAKEQNLAIRSGHVIARPVLQNQQGAQLATNAPWRLPVDSPLTTVIARHSSTGNCLRFALLNARSINNESEAISDLISDNATYVMIITETWHAQSAGFFAMPYCSTRLYNS